MKNIPPVLSQLRGTRAVALVAAIGIWQLAIGNLCAAPAAVVGIESTRVADLILLRGGFNDGLRQGMVCRLIRGSTEIAEIVLVELRAQFSSALILNVAPNQSIRSGDVATIKILKT